MNAVESLWKETKQQFDKLEKILVNSYIDFLREVAKIYLKQGRRLFFRENRVVHWGEGNFGTLIIEGDEEKSLEISFRRFVLNQKSMKKL